MISRGVQYQEISIGLIVQDSEFIVAIGLHNIAYISAINTLAILLIPLDGLLRIEGTVGLVN